MGSWRMCEATGKRSYTNKRSARQAMKTANNRIRLYPCDSCHGWHVTKESRGYEGGKLARQGDRR